MNRNDLEHMQEKQDQLKAADRPEPIRSDGAGALDLGPRDLRRNPAMSWGRTPDKAIGFQVCSGLIHIFLECASNRRCPPSLRIESCLAI